MVWTVVGRGYSFARHIIQWKCNLCLQGTVLAMFLGSISDISSSRRVKYSFIFCLPLQKHHNRVVRVSQVPSFLVITLFYCRHFSFIANSSVLRLGFSISRTPTRDFKTSRLQLLRISLFSLFLFVKFQKKNIWRVTFHVTLLYCWRHKSCSSDGVHLFDVRMI